MITNNPNLKNPIFSFPYNHKIETFEEYTKDCVEDILLQALEEISPEKKERVISKYKAYVYEQYLEHEKLQIWYLIADKVIKSHIKEQEPTAELMIETISINNGIFSVYVHIKGKNLLVDNSALGAIDCSLLPDERRLPSPETVELTEVVELGCVSFESLGIEGLKKPPVNVFNATEIKSLYKNYLVAKQTIFDYFGVTTDWLEIEDETNMYWRAIGKTLFLSEEEGAPQADVYEYEIIGKYYKEDSTAIHVGIEPEDKPMLLILDNTKRRY